MSYSLWFSIISRPHAHPHIRDSQVFSLVAVLLLQAQSLWSFFLELLNLCWLALQQFRGCVSGESQASSQVMSNVCSIYYILYFIILAKSGIKLFRWIFPVNYRVILSLKLFDQAKPLQMHHLVFEGILTYNTSDRHAQNKQHKKKEFLKKKRNKQRQNHAVC